MLMISKSLVKVVEWKSKKLEKHSKERIVNMDDDEFCYCHNDDTDEYHDCLDYMECEECPYYYSDIE